MSPANGKRWLMGALRLMIGGAALWVVALAVCCVVRMAGAQETQKNQEMKPASDYESTALGCVLYKKHCDACHGTKGKGNGPAAYALTKRPDDLSDPDYKTYSDEEYLEIITKGQRTMPRYDKMMTHAERMQVIAYVKTLIVEHCAKCNSK